MNPPSPDDTSDTLFSSGGPALTQETADLIRANLDEIVEAIDDQRTTASEAKDDPPHTTAP
jgi:hypothetical protein